MKPTHKTVYAMDIKMAQRWCVVGSSATAGTSHWRSAVKVTIGAKAKHSIKSRPKN